MESNPSNNANAKAEAIINQIHKLHAQNVAAAEETGVVAEAVPEVPVAPVEPEAPVEEVRGGRHKRSYKRAHKRTHKHRRTHKHKRTHKRTHRR